MVLQRDPDVEVHRDLYSVASWKVGTSAIMAFPVRNITETGGNRLVERERPYRDGAKLDDTGSKAKRWTMEILFENTIDEPGLEINEFDLYPDILDSLIDSFDNHETGDLVVPTRGTVRARADNYTRTETTDPRDAAILTVTFVQDNEDNVDAASFAIISANSNAKRLGEETTFDAQTDEMWDDGLVSVREFTDQLENATNQPGDVADDVDNSASRVVSGAQTTERAFSFREKEGRNALTNPESSKTARKLNLSKDVAYRAKQESREGRPEMIKVVSSRHQSIFSIAVFFKQPVTELIAINPKIENLFYIPKGVEVNVLYVPTT
jgi:prophage DNA circulation protein